MKDHGIFARPGGTIFVVAFVLFALFLLSQLGTETRFSASGKLFAQPRFWPAVGVLGMVLFGLAHLALTWRSTAPGGVREVGTWLRALEYLAWFMVYVTVVPLLGYLPTTVIFTTLLALRLGYRRAGPLLAAAALGAAIVTIFKAGLAVKIPGGAVYEFLPDALRNFMIVNF